MCVRIENLDKLHAHSFSGIFRRYCDILYIPVLRLILITRGVFIELDDTKPTWTLTSQPLLIRGNNSICKDGKLNNGNLPESLKCECSHLKHLDFKRILVISPILVIHDTWFSGEFLPEDTINLKMSKSTLTLLSL